MFYIWSRWQDIASGRETISTSEAHKSLKSKFESGNSFPFDEVPITYEEYLAIQRDDIHCVGNDTGIMYFKTKGDALKFMTKYSTTVGLDIRKVDILVYI